MINWINKKLGKLEKSQAADKLAKEKYPTISRYQKNKLICKLFKKYPELKEKYFLEIGSGTGELLIFLDKFEMKGEGIDISEEVCKIARKRVSENIGVKKKDFLKIKDKEIDLIIIGDVLEHIKNDEFFIKKTYESLSEGGYLLINVPAKMKLFGNWDIMVGHYRRYEKGDLYSLLERNGFKIYEFWSHGIPLSSKVSSYLVGKKKENKSENSLKSGIKHPNFMKLFYNLFGKFYWIINFQNFFLNFNLGSNFLILCKK